MGPNVITAQTNHRYGPPLNLTSQVKLSNQSKIIHTRLCVVHRLHRIGWSFGRILQRDPQLCNLGSQAAE